MARQGTVKQSARTLLVDTHRRCPIRPVTASLIPLAVTLSGCGAGACAECMDEKCADLISLCAGDDCSCMVECTGADGIGGVEACLSTCGLGERPPGFADIEACTAVACPDDEDECATPADWTPPAEDLTCDAATDPVGGGALADCGFDPGLPYSPDGDVLQLQSADGATCARIERRNDGPGDLANTSWTLLQLDVGPVGAVAHVEATDACWYSSHHNFRDRVHAWTGTRHYDLVLEEDGHGGARTYTLYAFDTGAVDPDACPPSAELDTCLAGPTALLPVQP